MPQVQDAPATFPLPTARPDRTPRETNSAVRVDEAAAPAVVPVPQPAPRPEPPGGPDVQPQPRATPLSATLPSSEEADCRTRLRALGAAFREAPPVSDPLGCTLPHPLLLARLSPSVALEPEALVSCAMGEAVARFSRDALEPAARTALSKQLVGIAEVSAYACRPRRGTAKLSEHASGNALDLGRFLFADGTALGVGETGSDDTARFLAVLRKAACGPFKTVLGPGSDEDHASHLHLDLARRPNGGTICQ